MTDINNQLVLIGGLSASGKSASLRNIPDQDKWLYLNCESNKRLPFKNNFFSVSITDPMQVYEAFQYAKNNPDKVKGIIIDSLTYLMDMYESAYVLKASNTMAAWSDYGQFFKNLMQQHIATATVPVIIIAHIKDEYDESTLTTKTAVPVKGALKNQGLESYFSTVVYAVRVSLKELKDINNPYLTITPEEELDGFKYVFQTRITKKTINSRIRSPMGMFDQQHTYIDNDAYKLLTLLSAFYES